MRYLITVVIAALSLNAFGQSGVCNYPISNVPTVVLLEENGVWLSATSSDPLIWDLDVVADSIFVTSCGVYQVQELVDFGDGWALPCAFISEIYVLNEGCTLTPDVCGDGTVWNAATSTCISANTADINNDGCVQLDDLLDLLISYGECGAEESSWQCGDPLEYQGYNYSTVQIGEQCWFAENLRAENYRNGDAIPADLSDSEWAGTVEGAVSFYDGDMVKLSAYGRLYNRYAVDDTRALCPSNWHVSTDDDWVALELEMTNQGYAGIEGRVLKATEGWIDSGNGPDTYGFSAQPAGARNFQDGTFYNDGIGGDWWTSSTYHRYLLYNFDTLGQGLTNQNFGFSVRCIKD
jgi:uncharacterized protein (TIGR02145 family)